MSTFCRSVAAIVGIGVGVCLSSPVAEASKSGRVYIVSLSSSRVSDPAPQRARGEKAARGVLAAALQRFPRAIVYDLTQRERGEFREVLESLSRRIRPEDTVMIYTHSHGSPRGLMLQERISWKSFAETILAFRARNVLVFTMSCFSGALVDELRSMRAQWEKRPEAGRSLLVLSAQNASSPAGPVEIEGQRMNGLPYALIQAFRFADGHFGRPRDGRLDMIELAQYAYSVSREAGSNSRYLNDSQMVLAHPAVARLLSLSD